MSDTASPPNDTKYHVINGRYVNRHTEEAIPADEPVFILRARDIHAYSTIRAYMLMCADEEHTDVLTGVLQRFHRWAVQNPDRMKEPDTPAGPPANPPEREA